MSQVELTFNQVLVATMDLMLLELDVLEVSSNRDLEI